MKRQRKRAKELAAKRVKDEEEAERRMAEQGEVRYGEDELKGLKVSHGQDDFDEGEETVLTLKDSRILDDEGELRSAPSPGEPAKADPPTPA